MKYIKGYDALRAVSIFFVICTHLGIHEQFSSFIGNNRLLLPFTGVAGVTIFFSLSGFLITHILLNEKKETGSINVKNFYIRRFLRLLPPLILFYIVIGFLMQKAMISSSFKGYLMSIFYIYNFVPKQYYTGELGHTWSLSVEEQFYLLLPAVLIFVRSTSRLYAIIFILLVASVAATYILPGLLINIDGVPKTLDSQFFISRWFIPAIAPIIIGSAFSIMLNDIGPRLKQQFHKNYYILSGSIALYFLPFLLLPEYILPVSNIFVGISISSLLVWIYYNQDNKLCDILEFKPLRYIGRISYGLYVYQGFFLRTGPADGLYVQQFPQNIILTVVVSILSYELFEKRILRLKNRFAYSKA
jgi:peptidoglycan/LPS O-acetylase OafA/YrhL